VLSVGAGSFFEVAWHTFLAFMSWRCEERHAMRCASSTSEPEATLK
jgi:hypothetical protein